MSTDSSEYDTFGPWIDEVRTAADVPRLYRDHELDLSAARLVLKVPRPIARRDAAEVTDLYDHLLILQADRLTVLSRCQGRTGQPGSGYTTHRIELADVVAVLDEVDLLQGRFQVYTWDGNVLTIDYNGSTRDQVQRLMATMRPPAAVLGSQPISTDVPLTRSSLGPRDAAVFSDVLEAQRRQPDLVPLAWHGRALVRPRLRGAATAVSLIGHWLSPATVHAAVVTSDGSHLDVFGRRERLARGRQPVHSASRLSIPLQALSWVHEQPHAVYSGVTDLVLQAGGTLLTITVPRDLALGRALLNVRTRSA
ncbi:hypothetical protein [Kineococcus sp. SYSU DK003]|uniref:hypothetical protein n=1 Tax=Kineococcus sp. SYSU DK003 TaxID=3383124 RepID=UPI003D7F1723